MQSSPPIIPSTLKKLALALMLIVSISSCSVVSKFQKVPTGFKEFQKQDIDSVATAHLQYDSIYIDHEHISETRRDTVYIRDKTIEYKYRLLRDTVHIVQIDTVQVKREVVPQASRKSNLPKHILSIMAIIGLFCLGYISRKLL